MRGSLVAIALVLPACRPGCAPWTPRCQRPLSMTCSTKGCPTFPDDVGRAQTEATKLADDTTFSGLRSESGTCGAYRFVSIANGFTSRFDWFDATGTLVARRTTQDAITVCRGYTYGSPPSCTPYVVDDYLGEARARRHAR